MRVRTRGNLTLRTLRPRLAFTLSSVLCLFVPGHGLAQTRIERRIANHVPAHLPLKVEVRNLDKDTWADDVEVEVWNTSNKPIYFLDFFLIPNGIKSDSGHETGFPLRYGRIEFVGFLEPIRSDDVPIKPGESHIFKINPQESSGWKKFKQAKGLADPLKFRLIFVQLNHGDGTGYSMTNGTPIDVNKRSTSTLYSSCKGRANNFTDPM